MLSLDKLVSLNHVMSHDPLPQVYELYNGGDIAVNYFIDTQPLEQLQQVSWYSNRTVNSY